MKPQTVSDKNYGDAPRGGESAKEENFSLSRFRAFFSFPALPIIFHVCIALFLAYVLNVWKDEASTLYTTRGGFGETFKTVFDYEKQAPLYFIILSVWRSLDASIFFARIFSVLAAAASIKFFYDLARRFFDERAAKFLCLFFALHPFLIWASVEIRVYALVVLLSTVLLKFFADGYLRGEKRAQIYFVLTAVVALYTNYYLGFLLVGCFAALLAAKKFGAAKTYFLQMLVVAVCIAPLGFAVERQMAANTDGFASEKFVGEGARILWNHTLNFIFPTELSPAPETSAVSTARLWLVRAGILAAIFLLARRKFRGVIDERVLTLGAIAATVGAFLLAAYFLLGGEYISFRHAAIWFAPLYLFVFALLQNVSPRRSWIFFAVIFAFLYPYSIYKNYPRLAKRGDWARVARYIEAREKPNQPIVVFQTYDALCLPLHYTGANKILPDERFFDWSAEAPLDSEDGLRRQTEFVISEIPTGANEIWLATGDNCERVETRAACRPLENFVEANYTVVESQDFYMERIRLLRKK